ncbi:MAG TPA: hypothetical protein VF135_11890, partial [Terriglobales bacterium]
VLERSQDIACQLDADLSIVYCNPAWDEFALSNDGDAAVSALVCGRSIMDFVPEPLTGFYEAAFQSAKEGIVEFEYECSSGDVFRRFKMQIFANRLLGGYTQLNSLVVADPMDLHRHLERGHVYVGENGLIRVCSHCRRSRRVHPLEFWDWVPAHLASFQDNITHGLCPVCRAYFYGAAI